MVVLIVCACTWGSRLAVRMDDMISPWMTPSQRRRATHAARKKVAREREAAKRKDGKGYQRVNESWLRSGLVEVLEKRQDWFRNAESVILDAR